MDRNRMISVCLLVLCIVLSASSYSELVDDKGENCSEYLPGKAYPCGNWVMLVLGCDLPEERPVMSAASILYPSVTNTSSAKSYALGFFPEFGESTFEYDVDLGCYASIMEDQLLWVYPGGTVIYSRNHNAGFVQANEFTLAAAISAFESFADGHGGLSSYKLTEDFQVTSYGENDEPTGEIEGYTLEYRTTYSGYPVYGADRIMGSVDAPDSVVSLLYRCNYRLDGPVQTLQVRSAESAWDSIPDGGVHSERQITIDRVELCYYCPSYREIAPALYPAWRFSSGTFELYVNAFNGTVYDV